MKKQQQLFSKSVAVLSKFFDVNPNIFLKQDPAKLLSWAESVRKPNFQLTADQHNFLIGDLKYL